MIIVASLALGSALMKTGGAAYLAEVFLYLTSGLAPTWVLSFLMLLMAILTNIVSNNAAAVIGTPIAIGIARQLNFPEEPFVLAKEVGKPNLGRAPQYPCYLPALEQAPQVVIDTTFDRELSDHVELGGHDQGDMRLPQGAIAHGPPAFHPLEVISPNSIPNRFASLIE